MALRLNNLDGPDIDDMEDIVMEEFDVFSDLGFDAEIHSVEHSPKYKVTEKVDEIVIVNREEISSDPSEKLDNVDIGEVNCHF